MHMKFPTRKYYIHVEDHTNNMTTFGVTGVLPEPRFSGKLRLSDL